MLLTCSGFHRRRLVCLALCCPACPLAEHLVLPAAVLPTCFACYPRLPPPPFATIMQTQELWSFAVPAAWLCFFATPEQWARVRAPQNALLMTLFLVHYLNRGGLGGGWVGGWWRQGGSVGVPAGWRAGWWAVAPGMGEEALYIGAQCAGHSHQPSRSAQSKAPTGIQCQTQTQLALHLGLFHPCPSPAPPPSAAWLQTSSSPCACVAASPPPSLFGSWCVRACRVARGGGGGVVEGRVGCA